MLLPLSNPIILYPLLLRDLTAVHKAIFIWDEVRLSCSSFEMVIASLQLLSVRFFSLNFLATHWCMELLDFRLKWKGVSGLILQPSQGCVILDREAGKIHCTSVHSLSSRSAAFPL